MVQKYIYVLVIITGVILVGSGLVVWKSVQLPSLSELLGDMTMRDGYISTP